MLDGTSPMSDGQYCSWGDCECQHTPMAIPAGWSLAEYTIDSLHVITSYEWGTSCAILGNGTSIFAKSGDMWSGEDAGDECGTDRLIQSGSLYKPFECYPTERILLSRQCRGAAGWGQGTSNSTSATYLEVVSTCMWSVPSATPSLNCHGDTSPLYLSSSMFCVPNNIYPISSVSHCAIEKPWEHVLKNKHMYQTGGLGKHGRDGWEVWVCMEHPCCGEKKDNMCFTYSEVYHVFVPWGCNSDIGLMKQ